MIGALIDGAIKRRKVVLGVTLIACLFGLGAYFSMPREAQPDIDLPYISVIVPFPGVSPEDGERLLVKPLEVQLQTIQGIKHMNAVARQGLAIVTLEFEPDTPKQKALDDVRSRTDLARGRFPPDAEPPIIEEESFADRPVIGVVLHGQAPERELARISRSLKERLEASPGVQEAFESGAREELLDVTIDPLRMEAYNVTANDLSAVIARTNQLVPGGQPAIRPRATRAEGAGRRPEPRGHPGPADQEERRPDRHHRRHRRCSPHLQGTGLHHPLQRSSGGGAGRLQAQWRQPPRHCEDHQTRRRRGAEALARDGEGRLHL